MAEVPTTASWIGANRTGADLGWRDPLPEELAGYYADLDAGRLDAAAAAHFSHDVLYAVPARGRGETEARLEVVGRDALAIRLGDRGMKPYHHDVLVCVEDGRSCLVEGLVRDNATGDPQSSFVASLQLDDAGLVTRYLAFGGEPAIDVAPSQETDAAPVAALDVVARYFDELDAGSFEAAVDCFSSDVLYSHPPYRHTNNDGDRRVAFRGHAELLAAFRARGRQSFGHRIVASIQHGPNCLFEGLVEGLPGGRSGSFVSSLSLDRGGRIQRYVSFYCEPHVARR